MDEGRLRPFRPVPAPAARRIAVRKRAGGPRPVLARRLQVRHEGHQGRRRSTDGRASTAAPASGSTIPGHGESGGDFADGTIGRWLEESLAVFEHFADGPQIVIGSSMGGWLALLLARELRARHRRPAPIAGLVLIAPAVDFTEELMWKQFPAEVKREIEDKGSGSGRRNIRRALSDHPRADRGGPQASDAGRPDRDRLPGAYPARRAGPRRAVAARGRAGRRASRATTWC